MDKVDWTGVLGNKSMISILKQYPERVDWEEACLNEGAIPLLEKHQDKIKWSLLSRNTAIFEIDYQILEKRIETFKEELMKVCWHPNRLQFYLDVYGYDIGDDEFI